MTYEQQEAYLSTQPQPQPQRKVKVQIAGYLESEGNDGTISRDFHTEVLTLLIPDNYFGWGDGAAIFAQVASLRPGFTVVDHSAARR
jgi:hypothetical protein